MTRPRSKNDYPPKTNNRKKGGLDERATGDQHHQSHLLADHPAVLRDDVLQLSRPHQYRICRAAHEPRSGLRPGHLRVRRQHLLSRLHGARNPQQSHAALGRRAGLAGADPDHLGRGGDRDGVRVGRLELLCAALRSRRRGGRLHARRRSLSDLLVPGALSRPRRRRLHHRRRRSPRFSADRSRPRS